MNKIHSAKSSEELYYNIRKCIKYTSREHNIPTIAVLRFLDEGEPYNGIRKWYSNNSEKYYSHKTVGDVSHTEEEAEGIVRVMPVSVTGARRGEIIIGTRTQSKNAIVKIYDEDIPPKADILDTLRSYPGVWKRFLMKLSAIDFFSDMSDIEKEIYLEEVEDEYDTYFEDIEGLKLQVLDMGESDFLKIGENKISQLLAGGPIDASVIANMFPGKPGSSGLKGRHTLIFRRGIWKVSVTHREVKEYEGLYVFTTISSVVIGRGKVAVHPGQIIYTFEKVAGEQLGIVAKQELFFPDVEWFLGVVSKLNPELSSVMFTVDDFEKVENSLRHFTPAAYKSLLQKIIRFRPKKVLLGDKKYPSHFVLGCSLYLLALSPGSFVPDIQRYVTGTESAFKRLVVTIFEDGYSDDSDKLLRLTSAAFLAQRAKGWKPSEQLFKLMLGVACKALNDPTSFVINIPEGMKMKQFPLGENEWLMISSLMDELRSFHSDLGMIRDICYNMSLGVQDTTSLIERPEYMKLEHCVDQHWAPEIAYTFPMNVIEENSTSGSKPFSKLFVRLFSEVTGVNPRRPARKGRTMHPQNYSSDFEEKEFVKITREAQKTTLMLKQNCVLPREKTGEYEKINYVLDRGIISGLLGAIEVRGTPPALVTLHPDDPDVFIAVRKPSRSMKDPFLTDERESEAIEHVQRLLKKGLPLNQSHPPVPSLKGATLRRNPENGIYYIQPKGKTGKDYLVEWDMFRKSFVKLPILKKIDSSRSLEYGGEGIVEGWRDILTDILENEEGENGIRYIRRALSYISTGNNIIEFPRIGRDGGGTAQAVSIDDVGAYKLLVKISGIVPSALSRVSYNALRFRVEVMPLLWEIKRILVDYVQTQNEDDGEWNEPEDTSGREMWDHQQSSLEEMKDAHNIGRKGNFLFIPVGLGKCLDPDTPVLMWNGDTKKARDVVEGDLLIGDDGNSRRVLSTTKGSDQMYIIKQLNGDDYIVNSSHILTLKYSGHRGYTWKTTVQHAGYRVKWTENDEQKEMFFKENQKGKAEKLCKKKKGVIHFQNQKDYNRYQLVWFDKNTLKAKSKVFTLGKTHHTKEDAYQAMIDFRDTIDNDNTVDISIKDYLNLPKSVKSQMKGYKSSIDFPPQDVEIEPYMLGLWLGDGNSADSAITNVDEGIIDYMKKWCVEKGYNIKQRSPNSITYAITGGFQKSLRLLGVLRNKHIPKHYLVNDKATRLALLAGLLDSDGYLIDNCYEITQKREQLSKEICYLARSLGFYVSYKCVQKTCTNAVGGPKAGTYYKCTISGKGLEEIPCILPRKQAHERKQKKDALVTGISVENIGMGEYCGFMIDGNGRFLLGDFTVTHNSKLVLEYMRWLHSVNELPPYVVYTLPSSAIRSIIAEVEMYNFPFRLLVPLKTLGKNYRDGENKVFSYVKQGCQPEKYTINLIEHDHLRRCEEELPQYMTDAIFVIDEVHKALNETKRTAVALELSHLSREFIALTGTPIIDTHTYKLIWWLEQIVPFEVNEKNFWAAANGMVARRIDTGVKVKREDIVTLFESAKLEREYQSLVPPALGGKNSHPTPQELQRAMKLCYASSTKRMVTEIRKFLDRGVFVVAKDANHQTKLKRLLVEDGIPESDVFLIEKGNSLFLTDEAVKKKKVHDYRVVITTIRRSEGYTLTRLSVMVTGVYPSNNATREQLEGRINRIGQTSKDVLYITVMSGILTYIYQNHKNARDLSAVLSTIAEEIV